MRDRCYLKIALNEMTSDLFSRTSSRPDLISITPIYVDRYNDCSHQVVITAASSREHRRNTAVVLAEDTSTNEILRADVILDVIHELAVLTTTRELYIEEVPETFKMWAFDSQGEPFMFFIDFRTN